MSESEYRRHQYITAGALVRGRIKKRLAEYGVEFQETKTLMDSVIRVKCTPGEWVTIHRWVRRMNQ